MPDGIKPLPRTLETRALEFLDRNPVENVFLTWLIESGRSTVPQRGLFASVRGGDIDGVAYFGRQVVLAVSADAAIRAFANIPAARAPERMIVAPRRVVEQYWQEVRTWHRPVRIRRASQPVFMLEPHALRVHDIDGLHVRRAEPHDWKAVADNSAAVIRHELEYDPRAGGAPFDANVRAMIDRRLWWIAEIEGRFCFFMNAGAQSTHTLQLQGIWTPPELRGQGLAAAALSRICAELLQSVPTLSLYVNGFNAPAIALYERTGFVRCSELSTLLF